MSPMKPSRRSFLKGTTASVAVAPYFWMNSQIKAESPNDKPVLNRKTFIGPWAGLPVAWSDEDRLAERTYRANVARCCEAGTNPSVQRIASYILDRFPGGETCAPKLSADSLPLL